MRINEKTTLPIKFLQDKKLGKILVMQDDMDFFDSGGAIVMGDIFKKRVAAFGEQVIVLSRAFVAAAQKSATQLMGLYRDIAKDEIDDFCVRGTFVYGSKVFMVEHEIRKYDDRATCALFVFDKKTGIPLAFYENDTFEEDGNKFGWISSYFGENLKKYASMEHWFVQQIGSLIVTEMFKKYATVETKRVEASKRAIVNGEKVLNETKTGIIYLDCKWFTTIVRSEGFAVRGHFRLQPKKVGGEWTKELIWISDFQKHGYTSKAKILSQE